MNITLPINDRTSLLSEGWFLLLSEPNAHALPGDVPHDPETIPAIVPGTVAASLEAVGRFDRNHPEPLIDGDAWYRRSLAGEAPGPAVLRFEGLATIAEVYLDNRLILSSDSMYERHDVPVELTGTETLSICFRALKPHLEKTGPRARWRPRLMNQQGLRLVRTTPLGFMPGWCPEIQPAGPWRPISLTRGDRIDITLTAELSDDGTGILEASFTDDRPDLDLQLSCNGLDTAFTFSEGRYSARLNLPDVRPWWPHTHGEPALYDVVLRSGDDRRLLARTGFRSITVDRGADGNDFAVTVNGERIFCRGSVWTSADIVRLPGDRESYEPWLRLARDAGMNMIRIPGIAVYESPAFFSLCDELGLMVWQDLMFANFDYPVADPQLMIHVKSETRRFLDDTRANPSLAVICGGSEVWQQGAMLGLPERIWKGPLFAETLADIAAEERPDLTYVPNSPSGGALPFYPGAGVAHYYGVGAYKRPLEDARRANIRFAAECLAFSNLSAHDTLAGGKAGIPRDAGADWDFEDVRDHYIGELYCVDPQVLRTSDMAHYLTLSRIVTGEVMEATFAEWRRPGSSCNGALTFTFQDVMAGPGWGIVGVDGRPKPAWFGLKRAFRPVSVSFADEGTNGLDVNLLNETTDARQLILEVTCLREGKMPVVSGRRELSMAPRSSTIIASTDLFGAFFDTNYAYRFGPPSHQVTVARLSDAETGDVITEAFHFPLGRSQAVCDAEIEALLIEDRGEYWLDLATNLFAQSVYIDVDGYDVSDNWFHLSLGVKKKIRLTPRPEATERPIGQITSLGSNRLARF